MSFTSRALAIMLGMTCSGAAHAAQPKPFSMRCTTMSQGMADKMNDSLGGAVKSKTKTLFSSPTTDIDPDEKEKTAIASLRSASVIVFGHDPSYNEYHSWILTLQHEPGFWKNDFDFTQGVTFLKSCLQTFGGTMFMGTTGQEQVIDAAFWEARGRAAMLAERKLYLPQVAAGKAWYATIVLAEKQKVANAGKPKIELPPNGLPQLPPQTPPSTPKP